MASTLSSAAVELAKKRYPLSCAAATATSLQSMQYGFRAAISPYAFHVRAASQRAILTFTDPHQAPRTSGTPVPSVSTLQSPPKTASPTKLSARRSRRS
ncbi:hypothetical protein KC324_g25 [Hortaea werneckii]|nr:hypothetical protein KC324_g25 [Hortaea werneckii]